MTIIATVPGIMEGGISMVDMITGDITTAGTITPNTIR